MENSGPSRIYIHYIYIPEYISISQGYQRARIVIIYINQYMDPLKVKWTSLATHGKPKDIREIDRSTKHLHKLLYVSLANEVLQYLWKSHAVSSRISINLFIPLLYSIDCFSS